MLMQGTLGSPLVSQGKITVLRFTTETQRNEWALAISRLKGDGVAPAQNEAASADAPASTAAPGSTTVAAVMEEESIAGEVAEDFDGAAAFDSVVTPCDSDGVEDDFDDTHEDDDEMDTY